MNIMEENDPILERRSLEEQESKNKTLKGIMVALALVALALAGVLYYMYHQKKDLVTDLEAEKEDLTEQVMALRDDYASLTSDYESINAQLDTSRAEIDALLTKLKNTEATDRATIRKYEKELGTLRSIMRNYINQIDSLNTLNHKLTEEAAQARKEVAETKMINEDLNQKVETLQEKVVTGSQIKARGIVLEAFNSANKKTDKSNKVVRLMASLTLSANDLAEQGPMRIYIRVKDPEGLVLTNSSMQSFTSGGQTMTSTASREIDYEGEDVDLSIYVNEIESYQKGVYVVDAYNEQGYLGSAELMLR